MNILGQEKGKKGNSNSAAAPAGEESIGLESLDSSAPTIVYKSHLCNV